MTEPTEGAQPKIPNTARKASCSNCGGVRNCDILGRHEEYYVDDNYQSTTKWFILRCRGCDYVFVQIVEINNAEYYHDSEGDACHIENFKYWPALSNRKMPEWVSDKELAAEGTRDLSAAMAELYGALDNDLRMLAAIGIRTTYDIASELLGIDSTLSFEEKLDALISSGRIGVVDKERLEMMVDAGSASAHRGWRPSPDDLNTLMDVLEHFIQEAFVAPVRKMKLDNDAAKVKRTVPPKPLRKKKSVSTAADS